MREFKNNELRRLDLTVLLVFMGLLRHRKATEVAAELAITQSGVSHALGRGTAASGSFHASTAPRAGRNSGSAAIT